MRIRRSPDNPSTKNTQAEREMANRYNRNAEISKTQLDRLQTVLNIFDTYQDSYKIALAENAVCCSVAELAGHKRSNEYKSNLYAVVNEMYVVTEDAQNTLSESARQQIVDDSNAAYENIKDASDDILTQSLHTLRSYDDDSSYQEVSRSLINILINDYLDHAFDPDRMSLIAYYNEMCLEITGLRAGLKDRGGIADLKVLEVATIILHEKNRRKPE